MPLPASELEALLRRAFPDAKIALHDMAGDLDHWDIAIADESFRGRSRVEQHKLVHAALAGVMGATLHAVQIRTKLPENA